MKTWGDTFRGLMRYLRSRGWRVPFILHGRKLYGIGVASPKQLQKRHHNDNDGKGRT